MRNRNTYGKRAIQGFKNREMNDATYALRREVMTIIYEFKNRYDIPRQTIRIVDRDLSQECKEGFEYAIGYAGLGANYVHIRSDWAGKNRAKLLPLVAHELVHSVTGFGHDENCKLMSASFKPMTEAEVWKACNKYFK